MLDLIPYNQIKDTKHVYLFANDTGFLIDIENRFIYQCAGCNEAEEYYIKLEKSPSPTKVTFNHYILTDEDNKQVAQKLGYI